MCQCTHVQNHMYANKSGHMSKHNVCQLSNPDNAKLGVRGSVVTRLVINLPSKFSFNLTLDDLFTSLALLNNLSENGISSRGILRVNCTNNCLIKDLNVIGRGLWVIWL